MTDKLIQCKFTDGDASVQLPDVLTPLPGCQEARKQGCLCPTQYQEDLKEGQVTFHSECPVHEIIKVTVN